MDLKHITGESIVRGDLQSISNLVSILFRIVHLTKSASNRSKDSEFPDEVIETFITAPKSTDSISTHESAFNFGDEDDVITEDPYLNNDFVKKSVKLFELERKQVSAEKRRSRIRKVRQTMFTASNQRKAAVSQSTLQARKTEELRKLEKSYLLRKSTDEHVMLRNVYKGLLKKMHVWKAEDLRDSKEKLKQLQSDAEAHRKSIDNLFQDRMKILKEQELELTTRNDTVVKSQRKMLQDLLVSQKQQQDKMMQEKLNELDHRRVRWTHFRKEAHEDLIAVLSVEKWSESLRNTHATLSKGADRRGRPVSAGRIRAAFQ
jgi:hypothetical protein